MIAEPYPQYLLQCLMVKYSIYLTEPSTHKRIKRVRLPRLVGPR
jgi:hypothetical protein